MFHCVSEVQVIKYIPYEDKNPFKETDGYVFEEKEDNPFDAPDEAVAEPKKVVKKPSPPTKDADDDLGKIVDKWDD